MTDLLDRLTTLRRPRLLIRAARHGVADYDRSRDLRRILRGAAPAQPARALAALAAVEADIEETRQTGDARYSIARHVEVLIALIAEAQGLTQGDGAAA